LLGLLERVPARRAAAQLPLSREVLEVHLHEDVRGLTRALVADLLVALHLGQIRFDVIRLGQVAGEPLHDLRRALEIAGGDLLLGQRKQSPRLVIAVADLFLAGVGDLRPDLRVLRLGKARRSELLPVVLHRVGGFVELLLLQAVVVPLRARFQLLLASSSAAASLACAYLVRRSRISASRAL